jgi:hypothetical protein
MKRGFLLLQMAIAACVSTAALVVPCADCFQFISALRRPGNRAFVDDIPSKHHISYSDARK